MGSEIHSGSLGVTGVKRSFSPKMLVRLQISSYGTWAHVHIDQLDTLYQSYRSKKFTVGSLGVTEVKRSFSLKNAISPSKYIVWS